MEMLFYYVILAWAGVTKNKIPHLRFGMTKSWTPDQVRGDVPMPE